MKKSSSLKTAVIDDDVFKALFANAFDAIILYDATGAIKYTSPSIKKISGFVPIEVIGTNGLAYIHPEDIDVAKDAFYSLVSGNKKKTTLTQRFKHKNGSYYWGEYTLSNHIKNPLIQGIVSNFRDVTIHIDEERARQKMEILYSNLQGIMESTNESIFSIDRNFNYLSFNSNHKRVMKELYDATISVGSNKAKALKGSQDEHWVITDLKKAMRGNQFNTERFIDYPKYRNRYISSSYNPIRDPQNKVIGVAVFVRDVTAYKQAESGLQKANSFLTGVLESTRDRIIAVDRKCNYLMFNDAHQRDIKFFSGAQVQIGENFIDVLPKGAGESARNDLQKVFKGENFSKEYLLYKNFFIDVSYNPIYNEETKIIGASLFVRDITSRKASELKIQKLNEELVHQNVQLASQEEELRATLEELSERNFELDQLMYKTSHDLRAPLSSILGLVNLAKMDSDNNSNLYISKIEGRINKLDEFIRSMLNYAKVSRGDVSMESIALVPIIETSIKQLQYLENFKMVRTTVRSTPPDLTYKTDPFLLSIILSNIISNTYKYTNDEVKSYLKIHVKRNRKHIHFHIEDNGIGIREKYQAKIFDMFYRATERSQGSGLGLYIVKQAVEKLNGNIKIKSIFGKGTKIQITLPISE